MYKPVESRIWAVTVGEQVIIEKPVNLEKVDIQGYTNIGRYTDITNTQISTSCDIGKNCIIEDSIIEEGVWINDNSILKNCNISRETFIGYFCVLINYTSIECETIDDYSKR